MFVVINVKEYITVLLEVRLNKLNHSAKLRIKSKSKSTAQQCGGERTLLYKEVP